MARESRERARYTPEFKDEAVRLVIESGRPIAQVARELKINDGTLGNWVARYRDEHPVAETPLTLCRSGPGWPSWSARIGSCGWITSSWEKPRRSQVVSATVACRGYRLGSGSRGSCAAGC